MITARLIDNIWVTRKAETLNDCKLMLAQMTGEVRTGRQLVVIGTINAGIGDRVVITTGSSVRRMLGDDETPVDAVAVGITDEDCTLDMEHT